MRQKRYSALTWQAGFDPETGEWDRGPDRGKPDYDRVYGHSPDPTDDDGWWVKAEIDIIEGSGVIVQAVTIRPSKKVRDANGILIDRTVKPTYGVNSSVLELIHLPSIRAAVAAHESKYAEIARNRPDLREPARERLEASKERPRGAGGRPRIYNDADKAQWAEDVLAEQGDGKDGILQRLTDLWASTNGSHLSKKGVASRVSQLNDEGWLIGPASSAVAGPKLVERRRHNKET